MAIQSSEKQNPSSTPEVDNGFFHEVLNDPGNDKVIEDIGQWIDTHL